MTDISGMSSSLVGFVVPWIVSGIKRHLLPWGGKAAIWLSLIVSTLCVSGAYFFILFQTVGLSHFSLQEFIASLGAAFSLSQVVYEHVQESL